MGPAFTTWCQKPTTHSLFVSRQRCSVRYDFYLLLGRNVFHHQMNKVPRSALVSESVCLPFNREFSLQIYYVISSVSFQIKRDLYRQEVCMMWPCCNNKKYLCEWRTLCSHPAGSVLLHYKVKYKEDMKEMSFNLYSLLPDTLDTQHAKELTEMQSEVGALNIQSAVRSHRITRRWFTEPLLIIIFIDCGDIYNFFYICNF